MTLPLSIETTLPDGNKYSQPTGLFINNEFVPSKKGSTFDSFNPATGDKTSTVYAADSEDVDIAVSAARKAFKTIWKKTSGTDRGDLLFKMTDLLIKHKDTLAAVEAFDSGKPKAQNALFDIDECIQCFKYYAGWADKIQGKTIETTSDKLAFTIHEPYGVVGQIIPWNYPLAMAAWKIAPAIAAGNTIVLKTAEQTPLSLLVFAELVVKESGIPAGVINILSGLGKDCGTPLAIHPDVDKIAFTGSTMTGRLIQKLASENLKAVTLECGGKSPLVIFENSNLEQAVKWSAIGIMSNSGQICTATSRIYVEETVYEKFLQDLKKHVLEEYKQGDPFNDDVVVGPQVNSVQQERVLSYIEKGKKEGARLILGGKVPENSKGYYIEPTIFADVSEDMTIMREEIFGPVVSISSFKTEEEALEKANNTIYGLGAAIFQNDITKAINMAKEIEAGMVWINSSNDSDIRVPFGGVKMSGFGRELGEYGIETYTQSKAIHVNLGTIV